MQNTTIKPRSDWTAILAPDSGVSRAVVELARDRIKNNVPSKKSPVKFLELSGGIISCGGCGKRLFYQRFRRSSGEGYHHYYGCRTRDRYGPDAYSMRGMRRSDEIEDQVWQFVLGLIKNPELLRSDLEGVLEQERRHMRRDSEGETKAWLDKLDERERKRSSFQDIVAERLITLEDLRTKVTGTKVTRLTAERELDVFRGRREKAKALEQDRDAMLKTYTQMTPEALDSLTPEERQQLYKLLRLRVVVRPDGWIRLSGAFDNGDGRMYGRNRLTMLWPPHTEQWAGVLLSDSWAR